VDLLSSTFFLAANQRIRRTLCAAAVLAALCGVGFAASFMSPQVRKQAARTQFETAERMREALNGRPAEERTRRDYQKVADAYRKVYYVSPASSKADSSVVAVAEILAEMGRQFSPDEKDLHAAIGQYEFLRREYPGSKYRVEALFTIGQIYKEDLSNEAAARSTFEDFLKRYPRNQLAPKAQEALAELNQPKPKKKIEVAARNDSPAPVPDTQAAAPKRSTLPRVTGIRHWSTADYTRVAIDLDAEVMYQAGRVPDPDRIFFDLPDTRLASTLVGKSFDVQDGFLKKIRVAQYQLGSTRVVLEVDDVAEYSAFLLPNPYRLIIDIHGREPHAQSQVAAAPPAGVAADEYVAKASQPVTPSNSSSPRSSPKSSDKQATVTSIAAATDAVAKPEQRATSAQSNHGSSSATHTVAQPPTHDAGAKPDGTAAAAEVTSTAAASSLKAGVAKPSQPIPDKTVSSATPTDTSVAKNPKNGQATNSKNPPKSIATVASANRADDPADVDLPSPGEAGAKANTKPTAAPTAVTVSPEKDKKSRGNKKMTAATDAPAIHEASPTAEGDRSLIRALGLKIGRIVIDAGHGGHDTGTIGPNGLLEKDLVLDVALRLGKLLESRLGADVIYTRDDDTFIPLETRTAIANEHQADLFVSVHANSSHDPSARGVETYYLNFTSNPEALEVAARENAVSEKSIHELQDLVKKITLKEKIEESRELASDVQLSLYTGLSAKSPTLRNRGVKKAPFVVLIGANMPSILAEISFVSNPMDEKKLETPDYRQKIAESLYKGIAKYAGGLSGVKVAAKYNKDAGQ
jgi:N-acetylmuramoyl-L-alanine amidase